MITPTFQNNNFTLFTNDNISLMKSFPDNHFDMIFADPPYLLSNNGFSCQNGKRISVNKANWDKSNGFQNDSNFHEIWISEAKRILKPEGTLWISGTYHNIYQCGFLLQKLNFHTLNEIVWFKPNASPNLSCRFFTASHESIIWAKKDKKAKHYFNYNAMKNNPFPEDSLKKQSLQMRSVWSIPTTPKKEKEFGKHPTQKPLALLKRIILASTKDNDSILDPFNGSGTTGIAATLIGNRSYVGCDLNQSYIDISIKRYNALK